MRRGRSSSTKMVGHLVTVAEGSSGPPTGGWWWWWFTGAVDRAKAVGVIGHAQPCTPPSSLPQTLRLFTRLTSPNLLDATAGHFPVRRALRILRASMGRDVPRPFRQPVRPE